MTGPLTLKQNFLEENFRSAKLSFQALQFLNNVSNFWKLWSITPFSQQTTTTKDKSFNCTGVGWNAQYKTLAPVRVNNFLLWK